jgi:hypothetical protein
MKMVVTLFYKLLSFGRAFFYILDRSWRLVRARSGV